MYVHLVRIFSALFQNQKRNAKSRTQLENPSKSKKNKKEIDLRNTQLKNMK